MQDISLFPIILSGGSGTRLWPLSRAEYPKQFLNLISDKSMIQETVLRLGKLNYKTPIVVCNEQHRFMVAEQLSQINIRKTSIILEPVGRNTAAAIATACFEAIDNNKDATVLVLASDHVITNVECFCKKVLLALEEAQNGSLVTFGVKPTEPHTGYGYIKAFSNDKTEILDLENFVEKPDLEKAKKYLAEGNYFWNSGMFVFKASIFLAELQKFEPEIYECANNAYKNAVKDLDFIRLDKESFEACPSKSIDYAVMEKTSLGKVIPIDCGWNDVGSWTSLWNVSNKDSNGNACFGDVITEDTKNSYVYSQNRLVTTLGLKDTIVIETKDSVLVAQKDSVQNVKNIVDKLKKENRSVATENRFSYTPWGSYDSIEKGNKFKIKHITVKPGGKLSVQMHYHRAEHWIIVSGTAKVRNGEKEFVLVENESTFIPLGSIHALENPGKVPLELIEVQSGNYLEEDDIVRFEDQYGRC